MASNSHPEQEIIVLCMFVWTMPKEHNPAFAESVKLFVQGARAALVIEIRTLFLQLLGHDINTGACSQTSHQ